MDDTLTCGIVGWDREPLEPQWRRNAGYAGYIDVLEARQLAKHFDRILAAEPHAVEGEITLEQQFREHADRWQRETGHISSPTQRIMHPSYQAILGMKEGVIPLLLHDLQHNRRSWFWALSYLTKENPISPKDSGKMDRMIEAWVQWGKRKGYV